jgi:hypothetical protein
MRRNPFAPHRRSIPRAVLFAAALAAALFAAQGAVAQARQTLYMRIDGVKGGATQAKQPLGPDAFPLISFETSVGRGKVGSEKNAEDVCKPESPADVNLTLEVSPAAVALWQLAAEGRIAPSASLVKVDPATGATLYRLDLEQVGVRGIGLQTRMERSAASGSLFFERIRIQGGQGEQATSASWDRARKGPWSQKR